MLSAIRSFAAVLLAVRSRLAATSLTTNSIARLMGMARAWFLSSAQPYLSICFNCFSATAAGVCCTSIGPVRSAIKSDLPIIEPGLEQDHDQQHDHGHECEQNRQQADTDVVGLDMRHSFAMARLRGWQLRVRWGMLMTRITCYENSGIRSTADLSRAPGPPCSGTRPCSRDTDRPWRPTGRRPWQGPPASAARPRPP